MSQVKLRCYDPRTGKTAETDNPALISAHYLQETYYGIYEVDWQNIARLADHCDALVLPPLKKPRKEPYNGNISGSITILKEVKQLPAMGICFCGGICDPSDIRCKQRGR